MSLLQKVIDQVSILARQNGVKCRGKGQVRLGDHTDSWIDANVQCDGAKGHRVQLKRERNLLEFACECDEYLTTGDPCDHVWATLLEAEAQGFLEDWEGRGPIRLEPIDDGAPDDDEDPVDDDHSTDPRAIMRSLIKSHARDTFKPEGLPQIEDWKKGFNSLREALGAKAVESSSWPAGRQILYVVDLAETLRGDGLTVELMGQDRKKDGSYGKPRHEALGSEDSGRMPDHADAEIIAMLGGAQRDNYGYFYSTGNRASRYRVPPVQYQTLVPRMCQTGRFRMRLKKNVDYLTPIDWDPTVWEFWLTARRDEKTQRFILTGELRDGEQRMTLDDSQAMLAGGLLFTESHVARLDHNNAFPWITVLRKQKEMSVPLSQSEELVGQLFTMPELPRLELPEELTVEKTTLTPKPRLRVKKPPARSNYYAKPKLVGELSFDYDGQIVPHSDGGQGIYQPAQRRLLLRDREAERVALDRLRTLGFREPKPSYYRNDDVDNATLELAPSQLPIAIRTLLAENWYVEADGQLYRQAGEFKMEVTSGIDWFELHGNVDFDGQTVDLPELLRTLRRGEKTVRLDDGTFGVLPEQWLQKFGLLTGMGEEKEDHVRFGKSQVGLLDALLMSQPEVSCDALFEQARQRLRDFSGVHSAEAPATFVGELRPYQREGLGWLEFLRHFSFGGCLADDMGLGKTVQVLALLEERRLLRAAPKAAPSNGDGASGERPGPSMVIAPRSLVFNWQEEASRFAPQLRVLDHTGIARVKNGEAFKDYDLILTTYGTMRNDITFLKDVKFDYVVLDEAQAVKNAASESAKAARLLRGDHRLALSGTPVQNHLGELWSLFEFLNPGMLGAAKAFQVSGAGGREIDHSARVLLSRALRPFILRRTKAQVAQDLPQRTEQTIHCELDVKQRKLYDDLKEHYRQSLLSKIAVEGIAKNKIQVLEALLRLRQAACHPGLIDKSKVGESSAKLDALLPQLAEVIDGGHKALVFSQFTSLLSIVRSRLDKDKIPYVYLDGRTRDRQEVVERFQKDEKIRLFLISLKAGGIGLNLTAAEYVFLLDPWWNPAVEAQAIDRAHRIGQTRHVMAYRLIAKDTVEEKVLQLQSSKRELADAIINADNSVIGKLGREDLELLLS
ncbi:MAG TPA: DEAD/DEAH box helicase [Tepidisphaeraceae bacterium]|jgi:hypothetical protein|nr:DEAD/DEAH box helicase [Tepidisphaeraceae bacterium]